MLRYELSVLVRDVDTTSAVIDLGCKPSKLLPYTPSSLLLPVFQATHASKEQASGEEVTRAQEKLAEQQAELRVLIASHAEAMVGFQEQVDLLLSV